MECRTKGTKEKFVLQVEEGVYLFQVLEFRDMEQYHTFAKCYAANVTDARGQSRQR